ncbi:MAG: sugar phosphate isomerase/epimerase family protein, partial [Armatimonadota bacterium]|nr:sugar phosphate isomerase/epimerase family protein [Armatimonadota bacterium]
GAAPEGTTAELKISSQEGRVPGRTLTEKLDRMEEWGIVGLEPGGGGLPARVEQLQAALKGRRVAISAVCAGYQGTLIAADPAERQRCVESIKELLAAAGALGSTGLIVVPAFNRHQQLVGAEARKVLVELLGVVGEHAARCGTRVLLEPLNRGEAYFLRQVADAAAICRDVNSPGVGVMGDFYHMAREETNDEAAFLAAGSYLHHVHLASRTRKLPGQDDRDFTSGFRGLKRIGYRDYCSFECGCDGDPLVEIPKSVRFLREQWARA